MSIVLGVTGGIGCGKSTVCNILRDKYNAIVLDADKIAKEVMKQNDVISKIANSLGNNILNKDASINYAELSKLVFKDKKSLDSLNSIVHPIVMNIIENEIQKLNTHNLIVLDVPLPIKEFIQLCNYIITVWAHENIRIDRVKKRSNLSEDQIISRMKNQLSEKQYKEIADFIIFNNNSYDKLYLDIEEIINRIKKFD